MDKYKTYWLNLQSFLIIGGKKNYHQKSPRRTSMDKIIEWVEKEGNKKSVSFSDSSSNNSSSSGSVRGSISGGNIAK